MILVDDMDGNVDGVLSEELRGYYIIDGVLVAKGFV
jgi:hypothetical protein